MVSNDQLIRDDLDWHLPQHGLQGACQAKGNRQSFGLFEGRILPAPTKPELASSPLGSGQEPCDARRHLRAFAMSAPSGGQPFTCAWVGQ